MRIWGLIWSLIFLYPPYKILEFSYFYNFDLLNFFNIFIEFPPNILTDFFIHLAIYLYSPWSTQGFVSPLFLLNILMITLLILCVGFHPGHSRWTLFLWDRYFPQRW